MEDTDSESVSAVPSPNLAGETSDSVSSSLSMKEDGKNQRKSRKKKSKAKSFTSKKKRGTYKPKGTVEELPVIGIGDKDLSECLLSDDEERLEYIRDLSQQLPFGQGETGNKTASQDDQTTDELVSSETPLDCDTESDSTCVTDGGTVVLPVVAADSLPSTSDFTAGSSSLDFPLEPSEYIRGLNQQMPFCQDDEERETASRNDDPTASSLLSSALSSQLSEGSASHSGMDNPATGNDDSQSSTPPPPPPPPLQSLPATLRTLIDSALEKLRASLPPMWVPVADFYGMHLFQLSLRSPRAIQKEITLSYSGDESILVHLVPLKCSSVILNAVQPACTKLGEDTLETFCTRAVNIVKYLNLYGVCVGADDKARENLWSAMPDSYVDNNVFQEIHYKSTCRSVSCERLYLRGRGRKRCSACAKLLKSISRRALHVRPVGASSSMNNRFMSNEETMKKLFEQREEIRKRDKKIAYLTNRVRTLLEEDGVEIDDDVSEDLAGILASSNVTPLQKIFLEEQVKQTKRTDARGHKWSPAILRFALFLHMKSRSAYEALRDSGAVRLPCSRTLYDYSHAYTPQPGIDGRAVKAVAEKLSTLKEHQQYVNVIGDEVHVSRNLVYRQIDGSLIGYTHLEEVEKEMARFEESISGAQDNAKKEVHLAKSVLTFMVKSITSDVKEVVAAYPCNQLTRDMLYSRSWAVVSRLERVGVKALSATADGCSVNRAYISMHEPVTKTPSGVIFDTINFCSKERRVLYFIADVAHLIKTIRNCFHNSGVGEGKTRCMEVNGEKIVWSTIVRLYLKYEQCTLRKTWKLNAQNVFPNSYSCMKVRFAAEVLSDTVALHIEQQQWPGTTETVKFIRMCNQFFDCLNGAHSSQHIRTRNENLKPYSDEADPRYDWLENSFLKYIEDWRAQARSLKIPDKEQEKKMLSRQSQEGIEIAIKGFTGATRFLFRVAAKTGEKIFINARAFSQDHLENYFSRQRGATGGSRNPNVAQFLQHHVSISLQKDLGFASKRSNAPETDVSRVVNEPLPKRPKRQPRMPP